MQVTSLSGWQFHLSGPGFQFPQVTGFTPLFPIPKSTKLECVCIFINPPFFPYFVQQHRHFCDILKHLHQSERAFQGGRGREVFHSQ